MGHKVLSQGMLDSSCYLYSIMNAFKSLTFPEMEVQEFIFKKPRNNYAKSKWASLVRTCPQVNDIFSGDGPLPYLLTIETSKTKEVIQEQFRHILEMAFCVLSDEMFQFSFNIVQLDTVVNTDFSNSVIIAAIEKPIHTIAGNTILNHFICITGKDTENFHIMCSWTLNAVDPKNYIERVDSNTGKYYNNMISITDFNETNLGSGANGIYRISKT
jgi:hypothetical protein